MGVRGGWDKEGEAAYAEAPQRYAPGPQLAERRLFAPLGKLRSAAYFRLYETVLPGTHAERVSQRLRGQPHQG